MASTADKVKWWGAEFSSDIAKGLRKNLKEAGNLLKNEIKASISIKGRTVEVKTSKSGKTRKKYGKRGSFPSEPGSPPHVQTGALRRGTFSRLSDKGKSVKAGTRANHAHLLELGTKRMAARPFIRPALAKLTPKIAQIIGKPITTRTVA